MKYDVWLFDGRVIPDVPFHVFDECMSRAIKDMTLYGQKCFDNYIVSYADNLQEDVDEYSI